MRTVIICRVTTAVPVIGLTGYLGAGKTTLLNHILRQPGARVGVVINDFGEINVDAGLVTGQIDEPASIAGGCLCCISDTDELDIALDRLSHPRLALDVIVVEASGLADPVALSRLIRFSGAERVRPGGIVDVVDGLRWRETVDQGPEPPLRYSVTSLVVVNKLDQLAAEDREGVLDEVARRVRVRRPRAHVVGAVGGAVPPALLYDVASQEEDAGQLPLRELLLEDRADHRVHDHDHHHDHVHADAVTVGCAGVVDPGPVLDLLENPPEGVYRIKGIVLVRPRSVVRGYVVHLVGTSIHVTNAPADRAGWDAAGSHLVAIGTRLDVETVRERLRRALAPYPGLTSAAAGFRRLQRHRRLSR